jgi:hypothetical protein
MTWTPAFRNGVDSVRWPSGTPLGLLLAEIAGLPVERRPGGTGRDDVGRAAGRRAWVRHEPGSASSGNPPSSRWR